MDSRLVGLSVLHVPTDILGLVAQAIVLYKYVRRLCLADSRAESSNRATNLESTKTQSSKVPPRSRSLPVQDTQDSVRGRYSSSCYFSYEGIVHMSA